MQELQRNLFFKCSWKIYEGILVYRARRVTYGLTDDELWVLDQIQGVDQIFTGKQLCEKARKKKECVYVSFVDLKKAYERVGKKDICTKNV